MSDAPLDAAGRAPIRRVTVAIPSWNGRRHLEACLPAVMKQDDPGVAWQVAVLDNGSEDDTAAWLGRNYPDVRLHRSARNLGFAVACNRLIQESDADAVALLNNDTQPSERWLAALVDTLAGAPPDVIAVAGKVIDWAGERLDFAGGILAFDGHAFQTDFWRPLERATVPATGTELLFATGSNMIVARREYLRLGGFDAHYFAYLEDVDFGWRAWSAGRRIIFSREAVVRHRGSATSDRLGDARRGFLFERNAFMTAYKNYDAELWPRMMPAIFMTLMSRVAESLLDADARNHWLLKDTPGAANTVDPSSLRRATRRLLAAIGRGQRVRVGVQAEAQLRALLEISRCLDGNAPRRARVQSLRAVSDRELLDRFPLYIVPTYPGDERLFRSDVFADLLPAGVPFERRELDDVLERS